METIGVVLPDRTPCFVQNGEFLLEIKEWVFSEKVDVTGPITRLLYRGRYEEVVPFDHHGEKQYFLIRDVRDQTIQRSLYAFSDAHPAWRPRETR